MLKLRYVFYDCDQNLGTLEMIVLGTEGTECIGVKFGVNCLANNDEPIINPDKLGHVLKKDGLIVDCRDAGVFA